MVGETVRPVRTPRVDPGRAAPTGHPGRFIAASMTMAWRATAPSPEGLRGLGGAAALFLVQSACCGVARAQATKTFIDYIQPTPVTCSPLSSDTWGVSEVLPRDVCNGIEGARGAGVPPEYYFWDGRVVRAGDGTFHLFGSFWPGTTGFSPGWWSSDAFHAKSTGGVLGPYELQGCVILRYGDDHFSGQSGVRGRADPTCGHATVSALAARAPIGTLRAAQGTPPKPDGGVRPRWSAARAAASPYVGAAGPRRARSGPSRASAQLDGR